MVFSLQRVDEPGTGSRGFMDRFPVNDLTKIERRWVQLGRAPREKMSKPANTIQALIQLPYTQNFCRHHLTTR